MNSNADDENLFVESLGPPTGFWLWRQREYIVYRLRPDRMQEEVLRGYFRNSRVALRITRQRLEHPASDR